MAISLASIYDHLLPGLMDIEGRYKQVPAEWEGIFKRRKSNLALERVVHDRYMGVAQIQLEGAPTAVDNNAGQRWIYNMEHVEVGLSYAMTRKAIADNLYKTEFEPTNLGLQNSHRVFWNIEAANILNGAATAITGLGGDGQPLASVSHPMDTGVWANTTSTQQHLNETSLISGINQVYGGFYDEAGLLIDAHAEELIVPVANTATAIRLVKTELRPGTGNNDVNAIQHMYGGLKGYRTLRYLTNPLGWFLKTNIDGLIYLDREAFEMDMNVDYSTNSLIVKSYERGSMYYTNPRCLYVQLPTT